MNACFNLNAGVNTVRFSVREIEQCIRLKILYSNYLTEKPHDIFIDIEPVDEIDKSAYSEQGVHYSNFIGDQLWIMNNDSMGLVNLKEKTGTVKFLRSSLPESFGVFYRYLYTVLAGLEPRVFIHASAVEKNGAAFLFSGVSGAGKTTIANMLKGNRIIHDDTLFLSEKDGEVLAHSNPYMGDTSFIYNEPLSFPVRRVFLLHQDRRAYLAPLKPAAAYQKLLTAPLEHIKGGSEIHLNNYLKKASRLYEILVKSADCFELHFSLDEIPPDVFG